MEQIGAKNTVSSYMSTRVGILESRLDHPAEWLVLMFTSCSLTTDVYIIDIVIYIIDAFGTPQCTLI